MSRNPVDDMLSEYARRLRTQKTRPRHVSVAMQTEQDRALLKRRFDEHAAELADIRAIFDASEAAAARRAPVDDEQ